MPRISSVRLPLSLYFPDSAEPWKEPAVARAIVQGLVASGLWLGFSYAGSGRRLKKVAGPGDVEALLTDWPAGEAHLSQQRFIAHDRSCCDLSLGHGWKDVPASIRISLHVLGPDLDTARETLIGKIVGFVLGVHAALGGRAWVGPRSEVTQHGLEPPTVRPARSSTAFGWATLADFVDVAFHRGGSRLADPAALDKLLAGPMPEGAERIDRGSLRCFRWVGDLTDEAAVAEALVKQQLWTATVLDPPLDGFNIDGDKSVHVDGTYACYLPAAHHYAVYHRTLLREVAPDAGGAIDRSLVAEMDAWMREGRRVSANEVQRIGYVTPSRASALALFRWLGEPRGVSVAWRDAGGEVWDANPPGEYRPGPLPVRERAVSGMRWSPISTAGAPPPGVADQAVWTGSELLVWNGRAGTGARYDPARDAWTTTNTEGGPPPGSELRAVWTGHEVLLWGGGASARYDPRSDTFRPIPSRGAPSDRTAHTAVWTGQEMIVWGGLGRTSLDGGGAYDPAKDTWRRIAPAGAPASRARHSAVWTGTEMMVWGGRKHGQKPKRARNAWNSTPAAPRGLLYDPAADRWRNVSTDGEPHANFFQPLVWTGSAVLLWFAPDRSFPNAARYDPRTDTWSPMSTDGAPGPRFADAPGTWSGEHAAVWTGTELLVWGGYVPSGAYDPAADRWRALTTQGEPRQRAQHAAVWTGTELLVWGGSSEGFEETFFGDGGRLSFE